MEECVGISPTAGKKLFMILACVACQDSDGWFETSRRRLADFAGVTVDSARRFLEWLDDSGRVEIESAHAGRVRRRFVWVGQIPGKKTHPSAGGWVKSPGIRPGGGSNRREIDPTSGSKTRELRPPLHNYNYVTGGAGASANATAPPPATTVVDGFLPDPELYPNEFAAAMVAQLEAELAAKEQHLAVVDENRTGGDA